MRGARGLVAALLLLVAAGAGARPDGGLPRPPVLPGLPGARTAAAPAPLDTLAATIGLPAPAGSVRSLAVWPDSVAFGGVAWVVARTSPSAAAPDTLRLPAWLEPAAAAGPPPDGLPRPDEALLVPVRVYGINPFRLQADGATSAVVTVLGQGTDGSLTAPVRDPRAPGWNGPVLAAAALALALLVLLARRLWRRRRRRRERPADRPLPGPAWPRLAGELETLLADLEAGADGRLALDRLAGLTRGYAADRFGIAGREMTGAEIAAACRRLGHEPATGRAFARLVDLLDARRFDPEPVASGWCRERAAELVAAVAAVRIAPESATGADLAAAEAAWQRLTGDLGGRGGEAA